MTVGVDFNQLSITVFNRLKADAGGSAVRAKLGPALAGGSGANGVISPKALEGTRPAPPFVVLRAGAAPGYERISVAPRYTWWIYDLREQGYYRISELLGLIWMAYDPNYGAADLVMASGGAITDIQVSAGQETEDTALNMLVRPLSLVLIVT